MPGGTPFLVPSRGLNDSREVAVVEPYGYASDTLRYPVLVVLDGDGLLAPAAGMVAFTHRASQGPGVLVLGVRSRTREDRIAIFTPTPDSGTKARMPQAGGEEAFRRFLEEELRPFIERRYRTTARWTLVGHSLAGLFAVSTFANSATRFTDFVAISPTLNWQSGTVLAAATRRVKQPGVGARLFISTADEGERYPPTASRTFDSLLTATRPAGIRWRYQHSTARDHATTVLPALEAALHWLRETP